MKALSRAIRFIQGERPVLADQNQSSAPINLLQLVGVKSGDGDRIHTRYPRWTNVLPIPPESLVLSTGSTSLEAWYVVAEAWAHNILHYLPSGGSVLDIGCGCGKIARFLLQSSKVKSYVGFDVIAECINWCNKYIRPVSADTFEFVRADVYAYGYNDASSQQAKDYVFPASTGSIDVAFGASLFTHLSGPEIERYLSESNRVLKSGGYLLASIHTDTGPDSRLRLGGNTGSEHRTDINPEYFLSLARQAGFSEWDDLGLLCGQRTFALKNTLKIN